MEMPLSDTHGDRVRGDFDAGDGRVKKEPGHISPAANALLGVMKPLSCKQTFCRECLKHTQRALLNWDLEVTGRSLPGFRPDD